MDYNNSSIRTRRPIRNNPSYNDYDYDNDNNNRYNYHQQQHVNIDNDDSDSDNDNYNHKNQYYNNNVGETSSRNQKKRRLENLGPANYDEWSENATFVLLEVWGDRFMQLGRRSLRGEDWVEVAEKISEMCKMEINDGQCRTRFETLKQKYKKEKAKMEGSMGGYYGKWGFFKKMDMLLSPKRQHNGLPCGVDSGEYVFMNTKVYLNQSNALDEMRDSPGESEVDEDEDDEDEESEDEEVDEEGFKLLAESVQNFGEIYEKIEGRKRQQMMELEKMRMDFQRELELQKKVILERAQAEIAKIREEDDEDANSVENLSG
ncbi:hypothetical protein Tco_0133746 [Tanacetum coccineum]